jgi:fibronectin type 3 domain-containing protein
VPGDATVTLDWADSVEADLAGYRVYRRDADGSWPSSPLASPVSSGHVDTGLVNGVEYAYRVTAVDTSGNESAPASVAVTPAVPPPDTTAPTVPSGLVAVPGDATVTLDWADNVEADLAGYRVYRRDADGSWPSSPLASQVASTYTDGALVNGVEYAYRVTAVDTSGNESAPASVAATPAVPPPDSTPPASPSRLVAVSGDATVTLDWADNVEPDLAGYRVYRQDADGSWPSSPLASPASSAFVDDTGLANGTAYTYRVSAVDVWGNESLPSTLTATPLPPRCTAPSPYSSLVRPTAGLAAYWRLGEASGTSACDSAGSNEGTYSRVRLGDPGAIVDDPDFAAGFQASNTASVNVRSASALNPSSAITVEAWIRPESVSGSQAIVRKHGQYLLRQLGAGLFARLWWSGGTYTEFNTGSVLTANTWQHLALTYDGATMRLFRNGVLVASVGATKNIASTSNTLYIGQSGGYDFFTGSIDEVAVYSAAVPGLDLARHYRVGSATGLAPPAGLTGRGGPGAAGLWWTSADGGLATHFRVYRQELDGTWPLAPLASVGTAATRFVDSGLANGISRVYRVTAVDDAGNASAPAEVTVTPTDNVLLAAGDIAGCDTFGDEATAELLDRFDGIVAPLGDLAYQSGTDAEFANCYDPTWGRHKWRTRPVVGDHEYLTADAAPYFAYFGAAAGAPGAGWYSYDVAGWHVVVLNSICPSPAGCSASSEQVRWLEADLAASTAQCAVAMWHRPRFTSSAVHDSDPAFDPFWRVLYAAGVELVLNGHNHAYERFAPQDPDGVYDPARGIRQIVVGTGGRSLYPFGTPEVNSEVRFDDAFGVLRLSLDPGMYSWEFAPVDGESSTDAGSGTCH